MEVVFTRIAGRQYQHWQKHDVNILRRIDQLLQDIQMSAFEGIGKPEPLRHELSGLWSRRISKEHRLVYEVLEDKIIVHQCRFHY